MLLILAPLLPQTKPSKCTRARVMQFAAKLLGQYGTEDRQEVPPPPLPKPAAGLSKVVFRWVRLLKMLQVTIVHAVTGSVITQLEQSRQKKADLALAAYKKAAGAEALAAQAKEKGKKKEEESVLIPMPVEEKKEEPVDPEKAAEEAYKKMQDE